MNHREEKDMRRRLDRAERLLSLACEKLGIPDQEILDMEKEEALDLLHERGDKSAVIAWLEKANATEKRLDCDAVTRGRDESDEKRRERRRGDAGINAA